MSKVYTSVKIRKDGSLVLPAFVMRGMGYAPGEEVPITTPADQYISVMRTSRPQLRRIWNTSIHRSKTPLPSF